MFEESNGLLGRESFEQCLEEMVRGWSRPGGAVQHRAETVVSGRKQVPVVSCSIGEFHNRTGYSPFYQPAIDLSRPIAEGLDLGHDNDGLYDEESSDGTSDALLSRASGSFEKPR
jgi:hypothetical protein